MRKVFKKVTALALATAVAISMLPLTALAEAPLSDSTSVAVEGEAVAGDVTESTSEVTPEATPEPTSEASTDESSDEQSNESGGGEEKSSDSTESEISPASQEGAFSTDSLGTAGNANLAAPVAGISDTAVNASNDNVLEIKDGEASYSELNDKVKKITDNILVTGWTGDKTPGSVYLINKKTDSPIYYYVQDYFDKISLSSGEYTVRIYKLTRWETKYGRWNIPYLSPVYEWVDAGTLTVKVYRERTFTAETVEEKGGFSEVKVNGTVATLTDNKVTCYDGDTITFKAESVHNYNAVVTYNGKTVDAVDGVYTITANDSKEIKLSYKLAEGLKVTASSSEGIKSITVNGYSVTGGSYEIVPFSTTETKSTYNVVITPEDGYGVSSAKAGDDDITDMSFNTYSASATLTAPKKPEDGSNPTINITAEAKKPFITLKESTATMDYLDVMSKEEKEAAVLNALKYNVSESVPNLQDAGDYTIEYKAGTGITGDIWKSLDFTPSGLDKLYMHAFGKDTEVVRVSFEGNNQYPGMSTEFTVNLVDPRATVNMEISDDYTVKYQADHDKMDTFVKSMRYQYVTMLDEYGYAISDTEFNDNEFTFEYNHNAGEQELTVKFAGNRKYKPAEATGTITVTKGDATVKVNSQTITYEETLDTVFSCSPEEAGVIGLIAGLKADGGYFVGLDARSVTVRQFFGLSEINTGIDYLDKLLNKFLNQYGNMSVQEFIVDVLGITEFKLSEFTDVVNKIFDKIPDGIVDQDIQQVLDGAQRAINTLTDLVPGISNAVVSLEYPTDAGVYAAVGFTTNKNYNTDIATGTIVIRQADATVTVNSQKITYGQTLASVFNCTPDAAKGAGLIAGINANGGYYVGVEFCDTAVQDALKANGSVTLKELPEALRKAGADVTGVNAAVALLSHMSTGIEDTVISFEYPTETGAYTAIGFTTNRNYKASVTTGYILIGQDSLSKELVFNEELPESKTLTISEAEVFNFGGSLEDVDTDGVAANSLINLGEPSALYTGIQNDGTPYLSSEPSTVPGIYTETVYVIGGNYRVTPISREYTIIKDQVAIYPVDVQKVYGDDDPYYYITEVVNGDWENATTYRAEEYDGVTVEREEGENVGSYRLTVTLDAEKLDTEEYAYRAPEDKTADLTITQREVTMVFEDLTGTYGNLTPEAQYTFMRNGEEDTVVTKDTFATEVSGARIVLLNGDEEVAADTNNLAVGEYTYNLSDIPEECNIKLTVQPGTLTINPRTVYLQVMDAAMTEGDNFPDVAYSFYEADEETGEKQDALAEWMRDELAENIVVSYADAAQGPKLLAGEYDMSLDQIMSIDEASASSDAKVYMSFSGLYDNDNYDVNLLTLDEAHTKLATLTVNKKASDGGSGSSDSGKPSTPGSTTGQTTISSVKTGDSSNPLLYVVLLLAVIFGITVIWRKKVR